MPRLEEINSEQHDFMKLKEIPWFPKAANHKGLAKGGIYLLSGAPGGGKTTLALQIACDLAATGHRVLYLTLEQSPGTLKNKVEQQVFKHRRRLINGTMKSYSFKEGLKKAKELVKVENNETAILQNLYIDGGVSGIDGLGDFLARQVLGTTAPYSGVNLLIVDSVQGLGTASTSAKTYQQLYKFNRWAKEDNITVILIGHVTKSGAIAGPRSFEHNVDCVLYLRKAMRLRPLFVPKNRFGAERYEPLTLIMNDFGCLDESPHGKAKASMALGFLPGSPGGRGDIIEVQALVKLPKYGDRPGIKAPYLPRQKLTQLVGIISSMHDINISDLTFEINCALPGGRGYRETLDLPLAMSMLSSYFQLEIPYGSLFLGEIDLFQAIRPLSTGVCHLLVDVISAAESPLARDVKCIYLSESNEPEMLLALNDKGLEINVKGFRNLEKLVEDLWPEVIEKS